MKKTQSLFFIIALMMALMLFGAGTGNAATRTWDGSEANDLWSTALNWAEGAAPVDGDDVVFDAASIARLATGSQDIDMSAWVTGITISVNAGTPGAVTVTVNAATMIKSAAPAINVTTFDLTLAGGTGSITLVGAATFTTTIQTLTVAEGLANGGALLTLTGTGPMNFSGGLTGAGGLTLNMTANEAITFSGTAADYTGNTTITSGNLTGGAPNMLTDSGTYTLANDANALITLGGAETIGSLAGGAGAGGNIDNGGFLLTVTQAFAGTYSGVISGVGGLTKDGAETLKLAGANTYAGATDINAGTLLVNVAQGGACIGAVTVANGATLGGDAGTVQGAITVQGGGIVKPGDGGVGTLTTATDVTFVGASKLVVDNVDAAKDVLAVGGNLVLPAGTALIELEAGHSYSVDNAVVTITGTYNSANEFSTANLPANWSIISTANTDIKLTYTPPAVIPTLTEWGMIIFSILLAAVSIRYIKKRGSGLATG